MGVVWQARDEVLGRDVAVKELAGLRHFSARERDVARRHAVREARATARLSHRNVVQVFDILEEDGCPWIVMELITPRSLRDLIHEEGPLSPAQAARLGLEILAALQAAHRLGIVHRDVKPANILMAPDRAVLVDFGIAQAAESLADVTTASMVIGSPAYIAPERARGGTCGPPADLWGLGASLYAAVEGSGASRTLLYDIAPRPGQRVRFLELTASGAARTIATVGRAGRGQLRFTTAPGVGARSIVAQFELNRLPAERMTVAHFQPPPPRLGRIAALHVARRGTTLHARWTAVPGASAYELVLTTGMTRQRRLRVRGTTLTLRSVPVATAGRITVRAVDTLRDGPVASAAFRATASPRTRLGRLPKAPRLR